MFPEFTARTIVNSSVSVLCNLFWFDLKSYGCLHDCIIYLFLVIEIYFLNMDAIFRRCIIQFLTKYFKPLGLIDLFGKKLKERNRTGLLNYKVYFSMDKTLVCFDLCLLTG